MIWALNKDLKLFAKKILQLMLQDFFILTD
jgi:hypothetical protein